MFSLLTTTFLSACAVGKPPIYANSPDFRVASRWSGFSESEPQLVDNGWLKSFKSARLEALVEEALENNRDIRMASARLAESRARARQAGAQAVPSLTGTFEAGVENELDSATPDRNDFEFGLDVSWEADLWGRIRGDRTAAALDSVAESLLYEYTRQSIAAQVTDYWIVINGNRSLLEISRSEVRSRSRTLENVRARIAELSALGVDENRAAANLALAENRVAEAEGNLAQSIRALEVLLGRYPDAELDVYEALPHVSSRVTVGLPSQLLERRPDVIAADRQVAAAFFRKNEAQAARLPRITLSASLTGPGDTIDAALDPQNIIWRLAGGILAPILDGGALKEEVEVANARQEAALANYGAVALNAFKEVEDALSNQRVMLNRLVHLNRAEREFRAAIRGEEERYEAGEIDLFRLSDTRLDFFNVQRGVVAVRVAYLRNRVQLHLALGGSFEVTPPAQETEADSENT